jgi:hypothetical protein
MTGSAHRPTPGPGQRDAGILKGSGQGNGINSGLVVGVDLAVGRTTVWGTEIQDICLLGWPAPGETAAWLITKPDGTVHAIYADPLGQPEVGRWISCEDLALMQKDLLGIPIPWT